MDREEVLRMAREAGVWEFFECSESNSGDMEYLERFANILEKKVAAAERKRAINIVDEVDPHLADDEQREHIKAAIRALKD